METCEQTLQKKWPGRQFSLGPRNMLYRAAVVEGVGTDFVRDEQAERNEALGKAMRAAAEAGCGPEGLVEDIRAHINGLYEPQVGYDTRDYIAAHLGAIVCVLEKEAADAVQTD